MIKIERKFIFFITFILLGAALTVQVRSTLETNRKSITVEKRVQEYLVLLDEEKDKIEKLKEAISEAEKEKESLMDAFLKNQNSDFLNTQKTLLDNTRLLGGLTDVKGPGVIVKMNDAPGRDPNNPDQNIWNLIIHDADVYKILNELKSAGAEALSINDERLIATSAQVCAGPTILINNSKYPVPYIIKAIGDPDALYKAVDESDIVFIMRRDNITIDISKENEIPISKYRASSKDEDK